MKNLHCCLLIFILFLTCSSLNAQRDDIEIEFGALQRAVILDCMLDYLNSDVNESFQVGVLPTQTDPERYPIVYTHDLNWEAWHNKKENGFLSTHRDYIQKMEQHMLADKLNKGCDLYVPLPSWDPSISFSIPNEFYNDENGPLSLLPGFTLMTNQDNFPMMRIVNNQTCTRHPNIDGFANETQVEHSQIHGHAGGVMSQSRISPAAMIFWLWHGHVDEMYRDYQRLCQNCDAAFVRAIGSETDINFTVDLSHSTYVENYTFTLIDRTDNSVSPFPVYPYVVGPDPDVRRIDFSTIDRCKLYTLVINGTNDDCSNSALGGSDEIELNFFAHGTKTYVTNSKFIDECDWTTVSLQNVSELAKIVKFGPNDTNGFYDLYLLNNTNGNLVQLQTNEGFSGNYIPDYYLDISDLQNGTYAIIAEKENEVVYEQFVISN